MITKICIGKWGCSEEKPIEEFTKASHMQDGYRNTCKVCNKKRQSIWQQQNTNKKGNYSKRKKYYKINANQTHYSTRDGYIYLYYKPSTNYIGVTNSKYTRQLAHKEEVIFYSKFKNRKDAYIVEAYLQIHYGYEGMCSYTQKYYKLNKESHIKLSNIIYNKITN